MTTHLSPVIDSPFAKSFRNPYILSDTPYELPQDTDFNFSRSPSFGGRSRNYTSVSCFTSSLNDLHSNGENRQPPSSNRHRSISLQASPKPRSVSPPSSPRQLLEQAFEQTSAVLAGDKCTDTTGQNDGCSLACQDLERRCSSICGPNQLCTELEDISDGAERSHHLNLTLHALEGPMRVRYSRQQHLSDPEAAKTESSHFQKWADSFRNRRKAHRTKPVVRDSLDTDWFECRGPYLRNSNAVSCQSFDHSNRNSNTSSAFVETIKTASLSALSSSIADRSNRNSRVSDGKCRRNSRQSVSGPRFSNESDRAMLTSSLDEAASHRASKRRRILDEMVSSERGYVRDLKALINVFSTLLASVSNINPFVRSSIQRNLMEMLDLHEHLLSELELSSNNHGQRHKVAISSNSTNHKRWHSMGYPSSNSSIIQGKSKMCMSPRKLTLGQIHSQPSTASPQESAEIARIFNKVMPQFFAYEEYCAKYEIMAQAFSGSNRSITSWQVYESGIEALTNSIVAIEDKPSEGKKGLTVGDLLIKPIQRICKYPLLFADLHKHTPVADCPVSHEEIDGMLCNLRDTVKEINLATDDPVSRDRIQRTWLLQERLVFPNETCSNTQLRILGHVNLCGVLHVAYQSKTTVDGEYMLCALFKAYLVIARPQVQPNKFDVVAIIHLSDLKLETAEDCKGLQCHTALYSWKAVFESDNHLYELILSACCASEEEAWKVTIQEQSLLTSPDSGAPREAFPEIETFALLDLKPAGYIFGQAATLARRLSIQRAATVGTRNNPCQIIIRNTSRPNNTLEHRQDVDTINRTQSLLSTHRRPVLAPKRSERIRLEQSLSEVYSKDALPFPGMTGHRNGHLIRASAGSLVRKLSLASMHGPFGRRSMSLTTVPTKQSIEKLLDKAEGAKLDLDHTETLFIGDSQSSISATPPRSMDERDLIPESSRRLSLSGFRNLARRGTTKHHRQGRSAMKVEDQGLGETQLIEEKLDGRKRWSNPLGLLKNISTDGMRHLLYSSKAS